MFSVFLLNFVFGSNNLNIYFQEIPPKIGVAQDQSTAKQYMEMLDSFMHEQVFMSLQIDSATQWQGYTFYRSTTYISCMPGLLSIEEAGKAAKNLQSCYDSVFDSSGKKKNVLPNNASPAGDALDAESAPQTRPNSPVTTRPATPDSIGLGPQSYEHPYLEIRNSWPHVQGHQIDTSIDRVNVFDGEAWIGSLPLNVKTVEISGLQTTITADQIGSGVETLLVTNGAKWTGSLPLNVKTVWISGSQTTITADQIGSGVNRLNVFGGAKWTGSLPLAVRINDTSKQIFLMLRRLFLEIDKQRG